MNQMTICTNCQRPITEKWPHAYGFCMECITVYNRKAGAAVRMLTKALKAGQVTKSDACELCGKTGQVQSHHWNGYDDLLNVWWLCKRCNIRLHGVEFHCGQVTKAEARAIVLRPTVRELYEMGRRNRAMTI